MGQTAEMQSFRYFWWLKTVAELREISDYERAFFKLTKIRQQVDSLSEFQISKIKEGHDSGPRKKILIDPRTGFPFSSA